MKRKSISILRLYLLANEWAAKGKNKKEREERTAMADSYLKYMNENKYRDDLGSSWSDSQRNGL